AALAESLYQGKAANLQELKFNSNLIGPEGAAALADAYLSHGCRELRLLFLSDNRLGASGVRALANGLRAGGARLQRLRLSSNSCGDGGAEAVAQCLEASGGSRLQELTLSDNGIGIAGAKALATALDQGQGSCCDFAMLNIGQSNFGWEGLELLLTALHKSSAKLETLRVNDCKINEEGAMALAKQLPKLAPNLKELMIRDNGFRLQGPAATALTEHARQCGPSFHLILTETAALIPPDETVSPVAK
ncbi:unnamed protein product, partial [Polarella glacialis]